MTADSLAHIAIIGEPAERSCDSYGGRITQNAAEVTCAPCRESWAYAVARRRDAIPAGWVPVSVEPAANFGSGHGLLAVSESGRPDQVVIEQADRLVYVLDEWVESAKRGEIPWAEIGYVNPWRCVLKIRGTDRTVIYEENGGCGPNVMATIFRQPD